MVSPNLVQIPDEEKLVNTTDADNVLSLTMPTTTTTISTNRNGPRKSVSIVLPEEENG